MKSIIFDVDGTLWDATEGIAVSYRRVCRTYGYFAEHITGARLKREFGKLMRDIGLSLFPDLPEPEMLRLMKAIYAVENQGLIDIQQPLYDGVRGMIVELHRRGVPIAIVSNCQSGYIETLLKIHSLKPYIAGHLCPGDTGAAKAENIALARERFLLEDPVYVGDTMGDFEAAKKAGVPFVFAAYGYGDVPEPDYVIQAPGEMLSFPELNVDASKSKLG